MIAAADFRDAIERDNTLVMFDFDGVLVDSEALYSEIQCKHLSEIGVKLSARELVEMFAGVPDRRSVYLQIERAYDVKIPTSLPDDVKRQFDSDKTRLLCEMNGARAALQRFAARTCIVSSGSRLHLIQSLRATGLSSFVRSKFFSGDDVLAKKPAPDIYLLAAEFMGFPLERCIAVEDSPSGIAAARAAGILTIAFCGGSHYSDKLRGHARRSGAHHMISSLYELLGDEV